MAILQQTDLEGLRSLPKPHRVISLVPSLTEYCYDLGLVQRLVGRTKFCIHPEPALKQVAVCGGTKNFRFDVIDQLAPDLIIANKEENYFTGIEILATKYPVLLTDIYDIAESFLALEAINIATHCEDNGLLQSIQTTTKRLEGLLSSPQKSCAYLIWHNPVMVAGSGTYIHALLRHLGLNNVFAAHTRYPEATLEMLQQAKPDLIFLSSEPYPFDADLLTQYQAALPYSKVMLVDGEAFSWYGSRLLKLDGYFEQLSQTVH